MAQTTVNYNLVKPDLEDLYSISVPNSNMDTLDVTLKDLADKISGINATILDLVYPIGRGFIDFTNTDYSNYLGFTWERELVGLTPIGCDNNGSNIGATKGNETHSHWQTIGANASALYGIDNDAKITPSRVVSGIPIAIVDSTNYNDNHPSVIQSETYEESSYQPSKVVAYWKRIR